MCSVALSQNNILIAEKSIDDGFKHAELLNKLVCDLFEENKSSLKDLSAISISIGPGSYTGLRIGLSYCKGICFGTKLPLIAINTLHSMANSAIKDITSVPKGSLFVPMIDARRMEVYCCSLTEGLMETSPTESKIINENSFSEYSKEQVYFFGNGSQKCSQMLNKPNFHFLENNYCFANGQIELTTKKFQNKEFENLAYLEPLYLKEFTTNQQK